MDGKSEENRPTLILFSLRERTRRGQKCWVDRVSSVFHRCLGQNDVTAWRGRGWLGGVGLLRENENAPTRRGQVCRQSWSTDVWRRAAAGVTRRKTSKRIDRPFPPSFPTSCEPRRRVRPSDTGDNGKPSSKWKRFFFSSSFARIYDTKPSHAVFLKRWITWTLPSFVSFIRLTYCFFLRKNGIIYMYIFSFSILSTLRQKSRRWILTFFARETKAYKLDKIMFFLFLNLYEDLIFRKQKYFYYTYIHNM